MPGMQKGQPEMICFVQNEMTFNLGLSLRREAVCDVVIEQSYLPKCEACEVVDQIVHFIILLLLSAEGGGGKR